MADEVLSRERSQEDNSNDERVTTTLHLQQIQQKQDATELKESQGVTNADAEFRRGLEELVRDHLNTCMALASCSSAHEPGISSSSNSTVLSQSSSFNSLHDDSTDAHNSHHLLDHVNDQCHLCERHGPFPGDEGQSHHADAQTCEPSISASCSGQFRLHNAQEEEEESNDQLLHLQGETRAERNGNLPDCPLPEARPRSRILSRWAAHHAQEMIITMERQAREAELLALAGLHAVSMLDASFLREPSHRSEPSVGIEGSIERPQRRASSLVQMWRAFEEEQRAERVRTEFEDRMVSQVSAENFSQGNELNGGHERTHEMDQEEGLGIQQEEILESLNEAQESYETENSLRPAVNADYREWDHNERNSVTEGHSNDGRGLEGDASQIGEVERDRVRQIVQQLMTETGSQDSQSNTEQIDNRASWLGDDERERVRELAREWVRVTNQQRVDVWEGRTSGLVRHEVQSGSVDRQAREQESDLGDTSHLDQDQNSGERIRQDAQRLHDHQSILDLLMRIERERQGELQGLLEHRAVSDFAHRNRLQSLLRGRFLRSGGANEEERSMSSAAGEVGQLRQRRAVSGLREGFRFRLETILQGQVNNRSGEARPHVQDDVRRRREANQQVASGGVSRTNGNVSDGVSRDWQGIAAARRVSELQTLEEATAYNMELRELLGRRSVTNILASEFRDRLDQLIRSLIRIQGRSPVAWGLARSGRATSVEQQQDQSIPLQRQQPGQQQTQNETDRMPNGFEGPHLVEPPPPPPPPSQPLWQQELQQQPAWPRPVLQRTFLMEGESIIELRTDVAKLRQAMSDLQRMMETCLEMQLELQRSVRQELSGALQRMYGGKGVPEEAVDGSKWVIVKRGLCCVCCDKNIDSLLYRCGHMCTCLKCASELIQNSGNCPMCRAPILEVVRAFTVA